MSTDSSAERPSGRISMGWLWKGWFCEWRQAGQCDVRRRRIKLVCGKSGRSPGRSGLQNVQTGCPERLRNASESNDDPRGPHPPPSPSCLRQPGEGARRPPSYVKVSSPSPPVFVGRSRVIAKPRWEPPTGSQAGLTSPRNRAHGRARCRPLQQVRGLWPVVLKRIAGPATRVPGSGRTDERLVTCATIV
jgi:hypothetical protein